MNALKTALTGRTILLPSDDVGKYEHHIQSFAREWQPATDRERALVQALADHEWRLNRIASLEMSIYAVGYQQFAGELDDPNQIELNTYLKYEKQLRNLQIQESRLRRYREKDTAELRRLQVERSEKEAAQTEAKKAQNANGFESSTPRGADDRFSSSACSAAYDADATNDFTHSTLGSCPKPLLEASQIA